MNTIKYKKLQKQAALNVSRLFDPDEQERPELAEDILCLVKTRTLTEIKNLVKKIYPDLDEDPLSMNHFICRVFHAEMESLILDLNNKNLTPDAIGYDHNSI